MYTLVTANKNLKVIGAHLGAFGPSRLQHAPWTEFRIPDQNDSFYVVQTVQSPKSAPNTTVRTSTIRENTLGALRTCDSNRAT